MLVLTRGVDESIMLTTPEGTEIEIQVVDFIGGRRVKLGINAPKDVLIDRKEIYLVKKQEGATADVDGNHTG
jgi:carbon storage regulator CsrA